MPVRSLTSSVMRWPSADAVHAAAEAWAMALAAADPAVVAVGYFGSYARGDSGVGSDLDLIVLMRKSPTPFERRATTFNLESLPVPTEALVYTLAEWSALGRDRTRFSQMLRSDTRWLIGAPPPDV
jgi:uncharacterized protein